MNRRALITAVFLVAGLAARSSLARTCTWNAGSGGTGGGNWSTAAAWSCGTGGTGPPAAADAVVFNATSIRPCAIDTAVTVTSISINSGYTGTVTQGSANVVTTSGGFTLGAGTFAGASNTVLSVGGAFTKTGGAFTHNSGTVLLTSSSSQTLATNGTTFYNLTINDGNGPVGYWKLDETASPSVDSSGSSGQNATWSGSPASSTTIPTVPLPFADTHSLSFDNLNSGTEIANFTLGVDTPLVTITAWINPTGDGAVGDMTATKNYFRIVDLAGTPFWITKPTTSGDNKLAIGINSIRTGTDGRWTSADNSISYGVWQHVAMTYDSSSTANDPVFYVNGVSSPATLHTATPSGTQNSNAATGHIGNGQALNRNFNGLIDELRIYDRILSATEIASLAAGTRPAAVATQTLSGNLNVAGALTIDSGTLATSSYTVTVTGATSITSGGLTVGSNNVTLNGGLVQQSQGLVTENTAGGHIILGTGQTSKYSDTDGTIQGFPTAAFNWSTFAYWNTYVVFQNFNGTTDRLFARSADGAPKYYWELPAGVGDIVGAPRWNMEGSTHYVYLLTTLGRVYKLSDDGTAFAVVSGWPYFNGSSATGTSPLVSDANNLYWCGKDSAGARQMFSLALSTKVLNAVQPLVGDVVASPALATVSAVDYLYTVTSGKVYRTPVTLASVTTNTQPTTTVNGRVTVLGNKVMFAEDNGTIWALSPTALTTTWTYQDTNATRHPGSPACSAGNQCSVASLYYENALSRTFFGDHDGHLYALDSSGALVTNYAWRPGLSTDTFLTAPLYRAGVIVIGTSGGKVFVVDQNGGSGPSLIRTYTLGSAISSISFNSSASNGGAYAIATANGDLYYLPNETDPTPGSN